MDLKIKNLYKDVDALILYALVFVYVLVPDSIRNQAVDRLDDPVAIALLAAAGAGRFAVRVAATNANGRVRVHRLNAISELSQNNGDVWVNPNQAGNQPAGVTYLQPRKKDENEEPTNA